MPGGRGAKKSGRGDGGRTEASRQSRRVQGMEPEEHKDLETVVRDARKAKKAARESEAVQGGDVEASAVQGSTEVNSGSRIPEVPEEHTREGGVQASEGGANAVEPPEVVDLVSSSDESVVEVKSEPVRAKEEAKTQSSKSFSAKFASGTPESDIREAAAPAPESGAAALDAGSMVLYVRREVGRWEEVNPGKVTPPSVVYEWLTPKPDANSYFAAAYATGDYLKWRLSLEDQDEAWIPEFHLARWGVGTAQDLMATTIPQSIMTTRECVAILQTLFFEAGFEFVNLIPGWSLTRASRIPESLVRSIMEETQNFIAVELVEWRLVIAGVPFRVNSEDHAAPSAQEQAPRLDYHKEDGDDDLLMTDYDADLLGRQFVLRFRVTGLRISRSPRGSSDAYKSSTGASLQNSTPLNSMSNGRDSLEAEAKEATPGAVPSVIGTSRASDESTASGVQTSYAAGDLGFQVTRTVIPSRIVSVDQGDVEMASSVHSDAEIAPRKAGLPRISATTSEPKLRVSASIAGFGGPRDVSADERSQHQSSKSEKIICVEPLEWIQESWVSFVRVREVWARPIELNVLRQQQEWQARMEQEQREFLARERLDALERERLREQRDLDARRQIQELTDRLVHAEIARGEAERRAQDVEARQTQCSTETQGMTQSITEAVRLERERLDAAYAERWQQHEAEADSERARSVSETYAGWKEQLSTMEQVQELEAEKERERESSENIQRFHAGQVRDLRATLAQIQARRATGAPDLATNVRSSVAQNPEVATRPQESSGLRATLAQTSADTSGRIARVKRGHGATETKVTQDVKLEPVSLGKTSDPRRTATSKASQDSKTDSKRSAPKKHQQKKKKRQDVNPPSDSDPSSDSSDDDSSSESSDDSSDGNPGVNLTTASTAQAGTTLLTFRPYINSNTLGEFDTMASLRERVHWWKRFANMAAQGGWSTKMRIQELKFKLSGAARDCFNQLPKHTQRDWKELVSTFRKKYCKARSSYSERYFTMEMKNSESALDFFYRLNSAAGKADIDFRKPSKRLGKHIRRFIMKLRDTRLKTSLQGQRFRSIADLEYALEQDEDVWSRSDHDAPPPRVRDFRADNIPQGRFKPKRQGRAYVTRGDVSDSESDEDPEIHARFQEITDEPRVSARSTSANSGSTREISGEEASTPSAGSLASMKGAEWTQTLTNEVYRVMDNMGWRPPNAQSGPNTNSGFRSPRRENPNWDKFCEKCGKWGTQRKTAGKT
ncbi:hypothetical protein PHYSODRAFT_332551 [Phytophthora sojae]|uniref:Retrotransposon gag domain-containing protein n=1 Tax=Phytophthora sojae (strain P6497) TaxID=1094619 RepID=G4ZJ09_PHYSP|nr:hypothetical protein PHYSODRAFT_332551 [Phytophthora sojae]EGZ18814.1 hypothetical protein PHYSODRAFT_332551 [Phytophthora sojae]|eukprot:XP_009527872.1 hypothetical protein PHYSODRAFT_332551 [Phytophthora sojae]